MCALHVHFILSYDDNGDCHMAQCFYVDIAGVVLPGGPRPAKAIFWLAPLASHNFVQALTLFLY